MEADATSAVLADPLGAADVQSDGCSPPASGRPRDHDEVWEGEGEGDDDGDGDGDGDMDTSSEWVDAAVDHDEAEANERQQRQRSEAAAAAAAAATAAPLPPHSPVAALDRRSDFDSLLLPPCAVSLPALHSPVRSVGSSASPSPIDSIRSGSSPSAAWPTVGPPAAIATAALEQQTTNGASSGGSSPRSQQRTTPLPPPPAAAAAVAAAFAAVSVSPLPVPVEPAQSSLAIVHSSHGLGRPHSASSSPSLSGSRAALVAGPCGPSSAAWSTELPLLSDEFLQLKQRIRELKEQHARELEQLQRAHREELRKVRRSQAADNSAWRERHTKIFVDWWARVNIRHLQAIAAGTAGADAWMIEPPPELLERQGRAAAAAVVGTGAAAPGSLSPSATSVGPDDAQLSRLTLALAQAHGHNAELQERMDEILRHLAASFPLPPPTAGAAAAATGDDAAAPPHPAHSTGAEVGAVPSAALIASLHSLLTLRSSEISALRRALTEAQQSADVAAAVAHRSADDLRGRVRDAQADVERLQSSLVQLHTSHSRCGAALEQSQSLHAQSAAALAAATQAHAAKERKYKDEFQYYEENYRELQQRFDELLAQRSNDAAAFERSLQSHKDSADAQLDKYEAELSLIQREAHQAAFAALTAAADREREHADQLRQTEAALSESHLAAMAAMDAALGSVAQDQIAQLQSHAELRIQAAYRDKAMLSRRAAMALCLSVARTSRRAALSRALHAWARRHLSDRAHEHFARASQQGGDAHGMATNKRHAHRDSVSSVVSGGVGGGWQRNDGPHGVDPHTASTARDSAPSSPGDHSPRAFTNGYTHGPAHLHGASHDRDGPYHGGAVAGHRATARIAALHQLAPLLARTEDRALLAALRTWRDVLRYGGHAQVGQQRPQPAVFTPLPFTAGGSGATDLQPSSSALLRASPPPSSRRATSASYSANGSGPHSWLSGSSRGPSPSPSPGAHSARAHAHAYPSDHARLTPSPSPTAAVPLERRVSFGEAEQSFHSEQSFHASLLAAQQLAARFLQPLPDARVASSSPPPAAYPRSARTPIVTASPSPSSSPTPQSQPGPLNGRATPSAGADLRDLLHLQQHRDPAPALHSPLLQAAADPSLRSFAVDQQTAHPSTTRHAPPHHAATVPLSPHPSNGHGVTAAVPHTRLTIRAPSPSPHARPPSTLAQPPRALSTKGKAKQTSRSSSRGPGPSDRGPYEYEEPPPSPLPVSSRSTPRRKAALDQGSGASTRRANPPPATEFTSARRR